MGISEIIFIAGFVAAFFGSFILLIWLSTLLADKMYKSYNGEQPLFIIFGMIAGVIWAIIWMVLIIVIEDGRHM